MFHNKCWISRKKFKVVSANFKSECLIMQGVLKCEGTWLCYKYKYPFNVFPAF